jgi:SnoaL-like domain
LRRGALCRTRGAFYPIAMLAVARSGVYIETDPIRPMRARMATSCAAKSTALIARRAAREFEGGQMMRRFRRRLVPIAAMILTMALAGGARAATAAPADPSEAVRRATLDFYVALNSALKGDLRPMSAVWSHGSDVSNMSMFGGRAVGWNAVLESFRFASRQGLTGSVVPAQIVVGVLGPVAYSICNQTGNLRQSNLIPFTLNVRATNIFRLENGKWKLVHHQADPIGPSEQAPVQP